MMIKQIYFALQKDMGFRKEAIITFSEPDHSENKGSRDVIQTFKQSMHLLAACHFFRRCFVIVYKTLCMLCRFELLRCKGHACSWRVRECPRARSLCRMPRTFPLAFGARVATRRRKASRGACKQQIRALVRSREDVLRGPRGPRVPRGTRRVSV